MNTDKTIRNGELLSNIRSILERKGLSQRDFAVLLGKTEAEISRWMSGKVNISSQSQKKIESILGEAISSDSTFRLTTSEVKIGIIGTGNIARRFLNESKYVLGVKVVAAYNPDMDQADAFCRRHCIAFCASSAEELFTMIDAVYVASPVGTHYDYTKMALEHGRHVLCEMPFTATRKEAAELLKIATRRNLVLLPAIKTAYCQSFKQFLDVAKSGIIGDVVDVSATVTNLLGDEVSDDFANERMQENFSYPILTFFKLCGLGYNDVHPFIWRDDDRLQYVNAAVMYDDAICVMKVGVGVKSEGILVVSGTKGYIYVPAPWWKPDYFEVRFEDQTHNRKYFFPYEADGLRYELQVFKDKINRQDNRDYVSRDELLHLIEIQSKIS